MRKAALSVALVVLACLPTALGFEEMRWPRLEPGDEWSTTSTFEFGDGETTTIGRTVVERIVPDSESRYDEDVLELVTIENGTSEGGKLLLRTDVTIVTWIRAYDGAVLRTVTNTTTNLSGHQTTTEKQTVYDTPCVTVEWPASVNDTWTVECAGISRTSRGQTTPLSRLESARVLRTESVTVEAGTFDALVIEREDDAAYNSTLEWWSPQACGLVRSETPNPYGGDPVVVELTSVACAGGGEPAPGPRPFKPTVTSASPSPPANPTPTTRATPPPQEATSPVEGGSDTGAPIWIALSAVALTAWIYRRRDAA